MPTEQLILQQCISFCLKYSKKEVIVRPPAPVQPLVRLPYVEPYFYNIVDPTTKYGSTYHNTSTMEDSYEYPGLFPQCNSLMIHIRICYE